MREKAASERHEARSDDAEGTEPASDEGLAGEEAGAGDPADPVATPRAGPASPETREEIRAEEELSEALDRLQTEFTDLNDRHLRLAAEFSNYRRRQETEMSEAWGRAQADLVRRLVDVLDDLQRVSRLDPADEAVSVETIVEGVDLVERKFLRVLAEAGVEVIHPEGEAFDPEAMEAMMRVPAESEEDDDLVAGVFQSGYRLKGHLVRPARVSVFKAE
jgi:molecular chaperone GrpE